MFKSAATKIAHNSTLPSLALSGNKDLRPLQDLITAEKVVLISLQKLSVDFTKASEALRVWGAGEGDDLGDILGASTTILAHFSAALSGYAAKEHTIRDHLKQVRTREEALDELKRRRKATLARADSAEKKLNKMGPEHKNLAQQTDVLGQLQAQIRGMDNEIMNEEAALGDFKRSSARALMGLKFGGLMEACEKGCVVGDVGRGVVAEISEEPTPPGLARTVYMGHQQTQQRVAEAERAIAEITFSALPDGAPRAPPRINTNFENGAAEFGNGDTNFTNNGYGYGSVSSVGGVGGGQQGLGLGMQNTGMSSMGGISMQNTGVSGVGSAFDYNAPSNPNPNPNAGSGFLPPPDVGGGLMDGGRDGGVSPGGSSYLNNSNAYQPPPPMSPSAGAAFGSSQGGYNPPEGLPPGASPGNTNNASGYGAYTSATQQEELWNPTDDPIVPVSTTGLGMGGGPEGPNGGRFATFPVRGRGYSLRDESGTAQSESAFAQGGPGGEAPPSLGAGRRKDTSGSDFMAAVLDAGEFGAGAGRGGREGPGAGVGSAFSSKQQERERERPARQETMEEPAPEYRDYEPTSHSQVAYDPYQGGPPSGPPPGAAPPVVGGVWMGMSHSDVEEAGNTLRAPGTPSLSVEQEDGGGDRRSTTLSEDISLAYMSIGIDEPPPIEGEGEKERQARLSKHVRFGDDSVFEEAPPEPPYMKRKESSSSIGTGRSRRVAPPTMSPVEDERALNAAAAREVSRELDALNSGAPPTPQVQVQEPGGWEFANSSPNREPAYGGSPPKARGDYKTTSPQNQYNSPLPSPAGNANQYVAPMPPPNREPSPLIPPAPPFSRKATLDAVPGGLAGVGAGHHNTPSWDGSVSSPPAQPAPFAPGHHTTPSWALSPASPIDGPGSPLSSSSPRLETPYRAPTANRSTSSLNTQVPPGARTISAAAFRRPVKTASSSDLADTSPLAFKKRLPASPYPQARSNTGSGLREASPQPPPPPPQQQQDDGYDYISAYSRDSQFHDDARTGSPTAADFDYGRLGKVEVVGGPPMSPGYSEGRFATDLDPHGLR
ncbi:hypothetical protein C8R46DRAFT_1188553 [Mycena filopes]|nr:hypothetical protein C8R46DRAFT_1188553 [Mycena filopes]